MEEVAIYTDKQIRQYDPTHTTNLRNAFANGMKRRFHELTLTIKKAVVDEDCFGLKEKVHTLQMSTPGKEAFAFSRSSDKVEAFMRWLQKQIDKGIIEVSNFQQAGTSVESAWTNMYISDSYKRGVIRARYELIKAGYNVPSMDDSGGINVSMMSPFHVDRLGLLFTRVFSDLKGITTAMDAQISRILAQGIADGDGMMLLARKLVATINGTGMGDLGITDTLGRFIPASRRAVTLARTEIIRAHHQATIQEYRNWAVEGVIVKGEWMTAGDDRVCFLANTKIVTKRGYIYIQDVRVGDYVLTHKDRYRKVIKLYHRKYDGNIVRVTLKGCDSNGVSVAATEDHLILVNNGWKKIKDIKIGDKVSYMAKKCLACGKLIPVFNTYCSLSCSSKAGNKVLWSDPKQRERVKKDNENYKKEHGISKIQLAVKSYQEKMKDEDFSNWFKEQVSIGQLESYKNSSTHLKGVILANQEKGKRDDWGWKNKERRDKDLIKAHIKIGQNHNGKTYIEKKIEWYLKENNIRYIPQKYFNNGERKFWVDFYLPEYNIIIEADGIYWHDAIKDKIRDEGLKKVFTGKILHFKEKDIRDNFRECVFQLENVICVQNCFVGVEVKKIIKWKLKKVQPVYNLEVEEDNTYTANKIVVHNCSQCESMQGKIFELDVIENMIPAHPQCRCIALPWIKELQKYK